MFSKSERLCLRDANFKRFSSNVTPTVATDTYEAPGPATYYPSSPDQRTTRKHLFLKDTRRAINEAALRNDIPGPGWYSEPQTARLPNRMKTPRDQFDPMTASKRSHELSLLSSQNPHFIIPPREEESKAGKEPSPASYTIPSLWHAKGPKKMGLGLGPCPSLNTAGRTWTENLDGRTFAAISGLPAPGDYKIPTPPNPMGGNISRMPRGLDKISDNRLPGPGHYAAHKPQSARLPVQFPATPRKLNHFVCGTDLRKQRRFPGPGSYYPLYKNIVKESYTV